MGARITRFGNAMAPTAGASSEVDGLIFNLAVVPNI
jgi:hypothetical protein